MAFDPTKKDDTKYSATPVLSKVKIGDNYYYLKDADARLAIDSILADYLKTADKTALQNAIDAIDGRVDAIEGDYLKAADKTELANSITTEVNRAKAAEESLDGRLDVIEGDGEGSIKKAVADEATARDTAIASAINALDVTDTAVEGKYVSAVKEVDGKIEVTRESLPVAAEYSLAKEGTTPEGLAARYYLTKDNVKVGEYIDIAKDQFLKDATFIAKATAADKAIDPTVVVGDPYIKFTFQTTGADKITYVAVKGLVDVYTAGDAIDITDNEISVKVKANDSYIEIDSNNQIASKGIDTAIADAVAAEATLRENADNALDERLDIIEGADTVDGSIKKALKDAKAYTDTETSRATGVEGGLNTRLTTAEGNITTLQGKVTTIEGKPAYDITDTQISNWDNEVGTKAALATEVARAEKAESDIETAYKAADSALDGKITAEANARAEADTAINTKIGAKTDATTADTVYGAINAEVARATAAEQTNATAIAAEKTRAEGVESGLNTRLTSAESDIDAIEAKEAGWDAKLNTVKINGTFKTVATDSTNGKYVDLGNIATTDGVIASMEYADATHTLTAKDGTGTTKFTKQFGDLADENLANLEVKGQTATVNVASATVSVKEYTIADAGSASAVDFSRSDYTPAGTVTVTLTQTSTEVASTGSFTPAGNITINDLTQTATTATLTRADYTPAGSVTVTLENNTVLGSVATAGTVPTWTGATYAAPSLGTASTDTFVKEGLVATVGEGDDAECLIFTAASTATAVTAQGAFDAGNVNFGTFNAGAMPTFNNATVGVASTGFAGTEVKNFQVTAVSYDKATANGASFTGTAATVSVSGNYDKATVNTAEFAGAKETGLKVDSGTYFKQILNNSDATKNVAISASVTTVDTAVTKND